jgi:4-hydroxy-4-methyl-2-oxoglutarate aldolase
MELNAREKILDITSGYQGDRGPDGRPRVADDILERMKRVTTEEAWGVLQGHGYQFQFEGNWVNLHPERVLVGRAVTCRYVPQRPDFHAVVDDEGKRHERIGGQNSWVIDTLVKGDVLVVELFGKIVRGTFIGDNLGTAVTRNTGGTGIVIDGSIRDTQRVRRLPINVFCKGLHPTGIGEVTLAEINGAVRIGEAAVLPGDVILGTSSGIVAVPPQLAQEVVERSEAIRLGDYWGKWMISEGKYTPGEIDRKWSEVMEADYEQWKNSRTPQQIEEIFERLARPEAD